MPYLEKPAYLENPPLDELMHYGMPRRSGRYPWGSGEDPYQHGSGDFLARVQELRKQKITFTDEEGNTYSGDTAIAKVLGMSTGDFRTEYSLRLSEKKTLDYTKAKGLREKGYSYNEIAKEIGYKNESSVRSLLDSKTTQNRVKAKETADYLRNEIKEKRMVDVGSGVEAELGISSQKLRQAVQILEEEGYHIYQGRMPQANNPKQMTTIRALCAPDVDHKEIFEYGNVKQLKEYISRDNGETFVKKFHYPESLDSSRLKIRYAEDGGIEKDGIIELRRGVDDLSLGGSRYSQVRILVDGSHYMKGMAIYSDDMPDGVDVIFNTNKTKDKPMTEVLKKIKNDPDNPFGSAIKDVELGGQYWYKDKDGNEKLGLINKRADEGDWSDWKDKLPSQFLSKQPIRLAEQQLGLAIADKQAEYDAICELTNPTVKKKLLETFANDCDSSAVHLHAAALPRQKYHVIIPINSLKDNEIYAPKYENGEQVALVRYPHGGTFEIPVLTVNNKHAAAKKLLGTDIPDAVGINSKVAERLSGADFDGDTVMVIPTNDKVKIVSTPELPGLKGFDPKTEYSYSKKVYNDQTGDYDYYNAYGKKYKIMKNTQTEMGKISNLITDMTLLGATDDEKAAAVRHSMVVIDAEKHKLDYRSSYIENNIAALKKKYQGRIENGKYKDGAATLISRAKSQESILKTQGSSYVNMKGTKNYDPTKPEGALITKTSDDLYYPVRKYDKDTKTVTLRTVDGKKITYNADDKEAREKYEPVPTKKLKNGKMVYDEVITNKAGDISYKVGVRTQESTKMAETDDAYSLISKTDTRMERAYANYANKMKAMANDARKEMKTAGKIEYSASANKTYSKEVSELMTQLNEVLKNKPRERQAQAIANSVVKAKEDANPNMTNEDKKKIRDQAIKRARAQVGAQRHTIDVTDTQWAAIQAGAISETNLKKILNNTDIDVLREKATPRAKNNMSTAQVSRMKSMASRGYTLSEIAKKMGVSTSTVSKYL